MRGDEPAQHRQEHHAGEGEGGLQDERQMDVMRGHPRSAGPTFSTMAISHRRQSPSRTPHHRDEKMSNGNIQAETQPRPEPNMRVGFIPFLILGLGFPIMFSFGVCCILPTYNSIISPKLDSPHSMLHNAL